MRLIDDQNNQLGVLSLDAALRIASEKGLDLVEVAPQASPPVCRLMDYGRFKFETIKREKDQRRKQNVIKLKEMKLRPKVAEHDFQTKFKGLKQFLEAGEKVKVTIMFRGREMVHQDIGRRILDRVADDARPFASRPARVWRNASASRRRASSCARAHRRVTSSSTSRRSGSGPTTRSSRCTTATARRSAVHWVSR